MNAELFGNVPRRRGSLGTSVSKRSAYTSRVSRVEGLTHKSKGAVPFASLKVIMTACSATEWISQRPLIPHGATLWCE